MSGMIKKMTVLTLATLFVFCALCVPFEGTDATEDRSVAVDESIEITINDDGISPAPIAGYFDWDGSSVLTLHKGIYKQIKDVRTYSENDDTSLTVVVKGECQIYNLEPENGKTNGGGEGDPSLGSTCPMVITGEGSLSIKGVGISSKEGSVIIRDMKELTLDSFFYAIGAETDLKIIDCDSIKVKIVPAEDLPPIYALGQLTIDNSSVTIEVGTESPEISDTHIVWLLGGFGGINLVNGLEDKEIKCFDDYEEYPDGKPQDSYDKNTIILAGEPGKTYQLTKGTDPEPIVPEYEKEIEPGDEFSVTIPTDKEIEKVCLSKDGGKSIELDEKKGDYIVIPANEGSVSITFSNELTKEAGDYEFMIYLVGVDKPVAGNFTVLPAEEPNDSNLPILASVFAVVIAFIVILAIIFRINS